ncbi:unnamed protein product [Schistosoma mattheei]|uniref:Uncharacterized protein n=1 Tax=Schistosoma mattheei TaxID=31246 RepID=A0A183NJL3_9TREM|nr:unnamed protein product [Schistosoma mattheei]
MDFYKYIQLHLDLSLDPLILLIVQCEFQFLLPLHRHFLVYY